MLKDFPVQNKRIIILIDCPIFKDIFIIESHNLIENFSWWTETIVEKLIELLE